MPLCHSRYAPAVFFFVFPPPLLAVFTDHLNTVPPRVVQCSHASTLLPPVASALPATGTANADIAALASSIVSAAACNDDLSPERVGVAGPGWNRPEVGTVSAGATTNPGLKIFADVGGANDQFGIDVAIDGATVIVGALGADDIVAGSDVGAAYVFTRTNDRWNEQERLMAADPSPVALFGGSVALSGTTAVIGAYLDSALGVYAGAAYVFTGAGADWSQQAKLVAADATPGDLFGASVAISGDYVVIGANGDDDNGSAAGATYVLARSGNVWQQQAKLLTADGAAADQFGAAVAIEGDTLVASAPGADRAAGAVYVFERVGESWIQQAKVVAADRMEVDVFGFSVALANGTLLVGAPRSDANGSASGAAYVFVRNAGGWTQQAKLVPVAAVAGDNFGNSAALSGNIAIVGANRQDDNGSNAGAAHVFTRSAAGWREEARVLAADGAGGDNFGISVALAGDTTVVGANLTDGDVADSGSAHVFDLDFDDDGLSNSVESTLGTDPRRVDTDGDGLGDGDEVNFYGTSPLLADTDGDGANDGDEIANGTDPLEADDAIPIPLPPLLVPVLALALCCVGRAVGPR